MSKEWRIASMRSGNQAMRRARKSANDWAHCRTGNCKTQSEMSSISQHNVLRCKCGEQRMLGAWIIQLRRQIQAMQRPAGQGRGSLEKRLCALQSQSTAVKPVSNARSQGCGVRFHA